MKFIEDTHIYAKELQAELPQLKKFTVSLIPIISDKICEQVERDVMTYFDDVRKPESEDSISDLDALKEKLWEKYACLETEGAAWVREYLYEGGKCPIWVNNEELWPDDPKIRRDLKRVKEKSLSAYVGGPIDGSYWHYRRKITLFTGWLDSNRYEDYLSAFVHVYFFALFHAYLDDKNCTEKLTEYYHAVVIKSLATFFAIIYLGYRGYTKKAEKVKESAISYSPIFSPRGGCRWLFNNAKLFTEVLDWAPRDFKQALRQLVSRYEYEIIMQKKKYKPESCICSVNYGRKKSGATEKRYGDGVGQADPKTPDSDRLKLPVHFFKLNQSKRFEKESKNGYAYARVSGHPAMKEIRRGDIFFSLFGGDLWAVGFAKSDCYKSAGAHGSVEQGFYVDIDYCVLPEAMDITRFKNDPSYPIRKKEPYVRLFDYPSFIRLMLDEAKTRYPQDTMLFSMIENML